MINPGSISPELLDFVAEHERDSHPGAQHVAGLVLEGMALASLSTDQSEQYFARSQHAFERIIEESPNTDSGAPTPMEVTAATHLNLVLPLHRLLVLKDTTPLPEMESAYGPFIRTLGRQATASSALLYTNPELLDDEAKVKRAGLAAMFNGMAVLGLLMRYQLRRVQDESWMPSPGIIEPESIDLTNKDKPVRQYWHANIWGSKYGDLHRYYKIYVRTKSESDHEAIDDPETSVVWLSEDLRFARDKKTLSPLDIIRELATRKEKGVKYTLDTRMDRLVDVIDNRTLATIQTPEQSSQQN